MMSAVTRAPMGSSRLYRWPNEALYSLIGAGAEISDLKGMSMTVTNKRYHCQRIDLLVINGRQVLNRCSGRGLESFYHDVESMGGRIHDSTEVSIGYFLDIGDLFINRPATIESRRSTVSRRNLNCISISTWI
jgi:hypothetical protein